MMNELLLQTMVEKLEDIELLIKHNNQNKTGVELKIISEELKNLPYQKICVEKIKELIKNGNISTNKLNERVQNTIEHRHHLHKGIWIAIALLVLNIFLLTGWVNSYNNIKQFRANDYKYRALKSLGNESLIKLLYNTDSLYKINPEYFEKSVIKKEEFFSKQPSSE
jgi:hypothetical protein